METKTSNINEMASSINSFKDAQINNHKLFATKAEVNDIERNALMILNDLDKKRDKTILELQQEYLDTSDSDVLTELYNNLLKLAMYTLKYGNYYHMTYDEKSIVVHDVVSSIIIRLMTKQAPVIESNPMAYLQRAILYASKPTRKNKNQVVYTDDYDEEFYPSANDDPVLDEVVMNTFSEGVETFLSDWLCSIADDVVKETLRTAFYDCIELGKPYQKYLYKLSSNYTKEQFKNLMEDFQKYLHSCI